MLTALEKHWPWISIFLLLTLMASFVFLPEVSSLLSIAVLALGLGLAVLFIVRRQVIAYRAGEISRGRLVRNLIWEIAGMLLTIGLAVTLSRLAASYLNLHFTGMAALVVSVLAALAIGALSGVLVQRTWGRLLAK
jgi:hypothetical protein